MKVHIYNENCGMAGRAVSGRVLEEHEDPDNAGDWTCYEGTPEELTRLADNLDRLNGSGHFNVYVSRKADALREASE